MPSARTNSDWPAVLINPVTTSPLMESVPVHMPTWSAVAVVVAMPELLWWHAAAPRLKAVTAMKRHRWGYRCIRSPFCLGIGAGMNGKVPLAGLLTVSPLLLRTSLQKLSRGAGIVARFAQASFALLSALMSSAAESLAAAQALAAAPDGQAIASEEAADNTVA